MACYSPLSAWQTETGGIVFAERGNIRRELTLPCGQCIGCRADKAQAWAIRCVHESQMHENSCFVTLTYDDTNLPTDGSLNHRHFQLFLKRLRKQHAPNPIRFFMCGEYGEKNRRPHYHALLFGYRPSDLLRHSQKPYGVLWGSDTLQRHWRLGYVTVGNVTQESAGYVAQYATKKITGPAAEAHYMSLNTATGELHQIAPEYGRMSLKPGIGYTWLEQYFPDVYQHDKVIINGKTKRPPKYYDKKIALRNPDLMENLTHKRTLKALEHFANNTHERLAVRETVHKARLAQKEKSL